MSKQKTEHRIPQPLAFGYCVWRLNRSDPHEAVKRVEGGGHGSASPARKWTSKSRPLALIRGAFRERLSISCDAHGHGTRTSPSPHLPRFMASQLSRAVDAFNAEIGTELVEPAPAEDPAS
jgi:hypothetical protein